MAGRVGGARKRYTGSGGGKRRAQGNAIASFVAGLVSSGVGRDQLEQQARKQYGDAGVEELAKQCGPADAERPQQAGQQEQAQADPKPQDPPRPPRRTVVPASALTLPWARYQPPPTLRGVHGLILASSSCTVASTTTGTPIDTSTSQASELSSNDSRTPSTCACRRGRTSRAGVSARPTAAGHHAPASTSLVFRQTGRRACWTAIVESGHPTAAAPPPTKPEAARSAVLSR